jgi:hypothetical protein
VDAERRQLRTWRERLATPLKAPGEVSPEKPASTNSTNPQTPDSLRVGTWTQESTNHPQTPVEHGATPLNVGNLSGFQPGPPHFKQIGPNQWIETPYALARCVYDDGPLADGDRLFCERHQGPPRPARAAGREDAPI